MLGKFYRSISIQSLSEIINAKYNANSLSNSKINRVLTQSQYVKPGDAVIVGPWYYAKNVINESLKRGVTVIFCEEKYLADYDDNRLIAIDNSVEAIEKLEHYLEQGSHAKRIAITGSVGKTTTTGLINSIMDREFKTLTTHSMSNSHGAILRHFQQLNPSYEYWVQEVGGVEPGYIESSARMLKPDIVVLTNIGISHLDRYGTKEGIFYDKSSLERYAKDEAVVILNCDDEILRNGNYTHKLITFSMDNKEADYHAENIRENNGIEFEVVGEDFRTEIKLNLYGKYNVYNALAAIAVGRYVGVPIDRIARDMMTYHPEGMRQNMQHVAGHTFLVDSFNAEPKTVLGSAQTLSNMRIADKGGRKIFVTGHIDKLGDNSAELHKALGKDLAKLNLDVILLFAGDSEFTYEGLVEAGYKNAILMKNRDELDKWLRENVTEKDITFYKSGQFKAALVKTIDNVYGTTFQNEQQFNEGIDENNGDFSYKLRQDNIVELSKYLGKNSNLKIPETFKNGKVKRIRISAFEKDKNIEKISIPDSVEHIGKQAFFACRDLTTLEIGKGLKYIGRSAFNSCHQLEEVVFKDGLRHIEFRAFRDCTNLKRAVIPKSVGYIGDEAFYNCPNLVIECEKDSYAQKYAQNHKLEYKIIG